ncbi:MAG: alpha/beta fold hydrolase [Spirochaetales bacterium]|nr:alpha/beta fold hydrolase [Spirochaetales bacterium]
MKVRNFLWLLIPAAIAAAFFLGPRVNTDVKFENMTITGDVEQYLRNSEMKYPDITLGTEKKVVWANNGAKTPVSLVFFHGFSGSRQEMVPVMERVSTRLKANLFYTRYAGHGRGPEAMAEPDLQDWVNDTVEAVAVGEKIGEKVIVVALSTGAPLAAYVSLQMTAISALILISANYGPADGSAELMLLPWGNIITKIVVGDYYHYEPINERDAKYATYRFRSEALLTMMASVELGRKTALENITIPVLFLYADTDATVSLPQIKEAFNRTGSTDKEIKAVTGAAEHVLAGDIHSPQTTDQVVELIVDFIRKRFVE